MKKLLLLSNLVLLFACASETEQKSLDRIAEIYNAKTSYSKGFNSSAGTETIRNFTAKVSESELIDSLNPNVTSSNIALLVYQGFEENEKDKYNNIFVELINKKGDTVSYTYPIPVLAKVHEKSEIFTNFSESVLNGDMAIIDEIRNTQSIPEPIGAKLQSALTSYKNSYGSIISYEPFGVAEISIQNETAYQFQSYLIFSSGKKMPYLVAVNIAPGHMKLDAFKFFN